MCKDEKTFTFGTVIHTLILAYLIHKTWGKAQPSCWIRLQKPTLFYWQHSGPMCLLLPVFNSFMRQMLNNKELRSQLWQAIITDANIFGYEDWVFLIETKQITLNSLPIQLLLLYFPLTSQKKKSCVFSFLLEFDWNKIKTVESAESSCTHARVEMRGFLMVRGRLTNMANTLLCSMNAEQSRTCWVSPASCLWMHKWVLPTNTVRQEGKNKITNYVLSTVDEEIDGVLRHNDLQLYTINALHVIIKRERYVF